MGAALEGVHVVELARYISGPYCGMLLADLGADVLKVEAGQGDPSRREGPWCEGESLYFAQMNRNKRGARLDLRSADGRDALSRLIEGSDVLVENFRPGVLEQMGFSWDVVHQLNPRCVLARISGFGQRSPLQDRGAFDATVQALTGLAGLTGEADDFPLLIGSYVVDVGAALLTTVSVLAALQQRERTGQGQVVEVTLLDSSLTLMGALVAGAAATGLDPERVANRDRTSAPADAYRARDGWVYVHAGSDPFWRAATDAMGRPEMATDPRFATEPLRLENHVAADGVLAAWISGHTVAEVEEAFGPRGVPVAKVNTITQALSDPALAIRDRIVQVACSDGVRVPVLLAPLHLSASPIVIRTGVPKRG